jgi:hypothetical protein
MIVAPLEALSSEIVGREVVFLDARAHGAVEYQHLPLKGVQKCGSRWSQVFPGQRVPVTKRAQRISTGLAL